MSNNKQKAITKAYVVFLVILFLAMIFPVYAVANRVFPLILGLPFGLFWIVLMEVIAFVVLGAFYLYEYGGRDRS